MNGSETLLFNLLRQGFPSHWHVMAQVSYGSFLKNDSRNAFMAINSKRADFVVLYPSLDVAAVFEYQGTGHFGNTDQSRRKAERSDAIKRRACREAGIPLIEVAAWIDKAEISEIVWSIKKPKKPVEDDA